jgi:hypothetical protein
MTSTKFRERIIINKFIVEYLESRSVYIPWALAWIWMKLVAFIMNNMKLFNWHTSHINKSSILIEAGTQGWKSIEFKELYNSAVEYLGSNSVIKFEVNRNIDYLNQVENLLLNNLITHYIYDPRTGSQKWPKALWQSLRLTTLFLRFNVVPIVLLTDLSVRRWRAQAAVVSVFNGVVITFMSARLVAPIFPHKRLLGPSLMPFSSITKDVINQRIQIRQSAEVPYAIFTGSLYEPRTSILKIVENGVKEKGGIFKNTGRIIGSSRVEDNEYWSQLVNADIVFTTSVQMKDPGADWTNIPHLLYRYLEVLTSGSLLIAEDVPAVRRYFTPGIHFISYESNEDAVEKINEYLLNSTQRKKIAKQGKMRADDLINARIFWLMVDGALGTDAIL